MNVCTENYFLKTKYNCINYRYNDLSLLFSKEDKKIHILNEDEKVIFSFKLIDVIKEYGRKNKFYLNEFVDFIVFNIFELDNKLSENDKNNHIFNINKDFQVKLYFYQDFFSYIHNKYKIKKIFLPTYKNLSIEIKTDNHYVYSNNIDLSILPIMNFSYYNFILKSNSSTFLNNLFFHLINNLNNNYINNFSLYNYNHPEQYMNLKNIDKLYIENFYVQTLKLENIKKIKLFKTKINDIKIQNKENKNNNFDKNIKKFKKEEILKKFKKLEEEINLINVNINKKGFISGYSSVLIDPFKDGIHFFNEYINSLLSGKGTIDTVNNLKLENIKNLFVKVTASSWTLKNIKFFDNEKIDIYMLYELDEELNRDSISIKEYKRYILILLELLDYRYFTSNFNIFIFFKEFKIFKDITEDNINLREISIEDEEFKKDSNNYMKFLKNIVKFIVDLQNLIENINNLDKKKIKNYIKEEYKKIIKENKYLIASLNIKKEKLIMEFVKNEEEIIEIIDKLFQKTYFQLNNI